MPLYWLLSLCALVLYIIMPDKINTGGGETNVLLSFFLIPLPPNQAFLLKNGWTLSYEYYFYFIFSFGMIFKEQIGRNLVSIILLVLMIAGM
ncbi:acyltransferase, partial [bacterium]|nr:acyltransferase [bacterium]